jgi:hypothetical protein
MCRRVTFIIAALSVACGRGPAQPSGGALVTFQVADEVFRVWLSDADTLAAARRAQTGGPARIPNGRIRPGTEVNAGWSWHLDGVSFSEVTIELCDGRPSDVEREGPSFGGGRYCPWRASVIRIDDGK